MGVWCVNGKVADFFQQLGLGKGRGLFILKKDTMVIQGAIMVGENGEKSRDSRYARSVPPERARSVGACIVRIADSVTTG